MADSKHTPGPWRNEGEDNAGGYPFLDIWAGEVGTRECRKICEVASDHDDETDDFVLTDECHANARLIASAPELLEALEGLLANLDMESAQTDSEPDDASVGWNGDGTPMTMTFGHIRRARAAAAKARGEAS